MNPTTAEFLARYPDDGYLRYHAPRYDLALSLAGKFGEPESRVLDIGRSRFAPMLAAHLNATVDTLGFGSEGKTDSGWHYEYDLNETVDPAGWRSDLGSYDLIVFCEVLEHLYTSPRAVLSFLKSLMRKGAHLILQTPNATVLHKRIQLLIGRQPFQLISERRDNPGHFREYTRREIVRFLADAELDIVRFHYGNYFDYRYTDHVAHGARERPALKWINRFYALLPGSMKPGMTFVARARQAGFSSRESTS